LFLVAEEDETLIGTVMAGYDGHRGSVSYLAVAAPWQRRGVGRRLMAEVERRLVSLGCPKVNLMVRSSNAQVAGFYHALGYGTEDVIVLGHRLLHDTPPR
jgi:ribosomal protein S18 acetylase RimI-like enzyme